MPKRSHVDAEIGARLRVLRLKAGLTQELLADGLGLTFQQVQKYEKGTNRIAGSRLTTIAKLLKVPVSVFFGEDGKGEAVQIDLRVNTRSRQRIMELLDEIDSGRIEAAVLALLAEFVSGKPKR